MTVHICEHLRARAVEPFTIVTSRGDRYDVPTREHASVNPKGTRMVIGFDDDSSLTVPGLHVAAIEKKAPKSA